MLPTERCQGHLQTQGTKGQGTGLSRAPSLGITIYDGKGDKYLRSQPHQGLRLQEVLTTSIRSHRRPSHLQSKVQRPSHSCTRYRL